MGYQVIIMGAGMSREYDLPTLGSAFGDLEDFDWANRPRVPDQCIDEIQEEGKSLWDCWNASYSTLDLEKTFSLSWFQASVDVTSQRNYHGKILKLFEPTLWHWFRELVRAKFRANSKNDDKGYFQIAKRIGHLNSTKIRVDGDEKKYLDYDPRQTIFVNLNWDPVFELELLEAGIGVRYRPPPMNPEAKVHPDLEPADASSEFTAIVLKPHGSLNWYYRKRGTGFSIEYRHPRDSWLSASCAESCHMEEERVAILPPLPIKHRGFRSTKDLTKKESEAIERADERVFPKIWRSIHKSIQLNPLLNIVGYSFPPSDMIFGLHIANALQSKRLQNRKIRIISPKKGPSRESAFKQKIFNTLVKDTRLWARTKFRWRRGGDSGAWLEGASESGP